MFKLNVTQTDINNGQRGRATRCPIAIAAKRHWFGRLFKLSHATSRGVAFKISDHYHLNFATPESASIFMSKYDEFGSRLVKPFSFRLGRPSVRRYW